jgi:hypothetical protein
MGAHLAGRRNQESSQPESQQGSTGAHLVGRRIEESSTVVFDKSMHEC